MNPSGLRSCVHLLWLVLGLCMLGRAFATQSESRMIDPQQLTHTSGQVIYQHVCQGCHMPDARGATGAGQFPSLAANPRLASADYVITVLLMGRSNMPSFRARPDLKGFEIMVHVTLTDAEIARVINYVRSHFGNHYPGQVTPAQVASHHPATESSP